MSQCDSDAALDKMFNHLAEQQGQGSVTSYTLKHCQPLPCQECFITCKFESSFKYNLVLLYRSWTKGSKCNG